MDELIQKCFSGLSRSDQLKYYVQLTDVRGNPHASVFECVQGGLLLLDLQLPRIYPEGHREYYSKSNNIWTNSDAFKLECLVQYFDACRSEYSAAEITEERAKPIDWWDITEYLIIFANDENNSIVSGVLTDDALRKFYPDSKKRSGVCEHFAFATCLFNIARVEAGERTLSRLREVIMLYSHSPYFQQWMIKHKQNQREELSTNFFMILVVAAVASAALYFMYSIMMAIHQPTPKPRHPCVAYTGDSGCGTSSDYGSTAYKINRMIESSR